MFFFDEYRFFTTSRLHRLTREPSDPVDVSDIISDSQVDILFGTFFLTGISRVWETGLSHIFLRSGWLFFSFSPGIRMDIPLTV